MPINLPKVATLGKEEKCFYPLKTRRIITENDSTRAPVVHQQNPAQNSSTSLPLLVWGTYDLGKPRVRILLRGLAEAGAETIHMHGPVWLGIEDKSQIRKLRIWLRIALLVARHYPMLIFKYLRAPKHRFVLLPYLSTLDVLLLWPFAKLRGARLVWDVFVPLYGGLVQDRAVVTDGSLPARLIYAVEALAARLADYCFLDTQAHADYFASLYGLDPSRVGAVPVGVEPEAFPFSPMGELEPSSATRPIRVLFYGQFIPLHGTATILQAAQMAKTTGLNIEWTVIGTGQEAPAFGSALSEAGLEQVNWIRWAAYDQLKGYIKDADICLGIFGDTGKADRVIPNKVYQIIASGKPLVTRESAALRELTAMFDFQGRFVPPSDPKALLTAIVDDARALRSQPRSPQRPSLDQISPKAVGETFLAMLERFKAQP